MTVSTVLHTERLLLSDRDRELRGGCSHPVNDARARLVGARGCDEAARAAIAWAAETFGLIRLWASTDARHVRSRRVMEKLGMQLEEVRAGEHVGGAGEIVDKVVYSVTLPQRVRATG
jgi:hypothetical protein